MEEGEESESAKYIMEFLQPFDLFQAPLMRAKVIQFRADRHMLLWDIHHSIADGYSCTLITKRFMELYEGTAVEIKPKTYDDFIALQNSMMTTDSYKESMDFWKMELGNQDYRISFPLDYQRTEENNTDGNNVKQRIGSKELLVLKTFAKEMKCSLYQVLYGAFALLLHKMTGQKEFVIGTPVNIRQEDYWDMVGLITNSVAIKNKVEDSSQLEAYLSEVKWHCAQSVAHSQVHFADLAALTAANQKLNHNPVYDTIFVFEDGKERENLITGLTCERLEIPVSQSFYDLSFEIVEEYEQLTLCITYKKSLYKKESVQRFIRYYRELLEEMIRRPDEKISSYLSEYKEEWEKDRERQNLFLQLEEEAVKERKAGLLRQHTGNVTELEEELSDYWKDSLHLEYVDIHENFFDLGGRSIDAINLMDKLRTRYTVSIMDLFKYPTVELLAQKIERERKKTGEKIENELEKDTKSVNSEKNEDRQPLHSQGQMPIAIIGMAGRFPKSHTVEEFWNNLVDGKECISIISKEELIQEGIPEEEIEDPDYICAKGILEHAECFDAAFFEYSPKEAEKMDPQIRVFHECAWNAMEDAGYSPDSLNRDSQGEQRIGVFAGSATNYTWMSHIYQPVTDEQERLERISLNDKDYLATRISYKMNLTGPSYGVQTACSSSLTSIHLACRSLELGECEMALAGGISVMLPEKAGYHYKEGMILSKDGHCRVFDKDATGTVFSDGVGVLVLKSLAKAKEDKDHIYATIIGSAVNNDGSRKAGYTAPSIDGQAQVVKQALDNAHISPSQISYLEAHGTGTVLGDPIELEGLKEVYRNTGVSYCALGSLKSNFGHMDAAAGVAGIIKTALALKNHKIPASIHCENPNPDIELDQSPFYIPQKTVDWKVEIEEDNAVLPRRAGVTSLGFGGTNAHVILEESEAVEDEENTEKNTCRIFPFSARMKPALERMLQQYRSFFEEHKELKLSEAAYTLQTGRKSFAYRSVVTASTREELLESLCKVTADASKKQDSVEKEKAQVVFLFTGQGSQYVNMAKGLYEKEEGFRTYLDECFSVAREQLGCETDYKSILFPNEGEEEKSSQRINETGNTQVILFMLEYSMASFLMKLGVQPDALIGHSLGEYAAACIAGVFSLKDGLRLIIRRAELMQSVSRGGMDALRVPEKMVLSLIGESGRNVNLATQNGVKNCVVSGSYEELEAFEQVLDRQNIDYRRLHTSHAFHSAMMDCILEDFEKIIREIPMSQPKIQYISNLTGDWITDQVLKPEYWSSHLRHTVRFYDGLNTLLKRNSVFVEIGPGNVLSTLVKQCSELGNVHSVYHMIRHPKEHTEDEVHFMKRIGEMWSGGLDIDFRAFYGSSVPAKTSLPGYPFMGQEFKSPRYLDEGRKPLPLEDWFYRPCLKFRNGKASRTFSENTAVLLLGERNALTDYLAQNLKQEGVHCKVILDSEGWKTELQEQIMQCGEHHQELCVINLLPYREALLETCFGQMLQLIQLMEKCINAKLYVITKSRTDMSGLYNSLINGLCSVAAKEYENLSCMEIELEEKTDDKHAADQIIRECFSLYAGKGTSIYVTYKNGIRLEQGEESVELPDHAEAVLKTKGTYLVTGGMGGIGRYLTDFLIKNYQANVLLLAKSSLPKEEKWEELSKEQGNATVTSKIQSLIKWKEEEANVSVKVCDICDESSVETYVNEFERTYGKIQGVFHLAGVKGDGMIRFKTEEQAMEVIRPKVQGIQVLDKIFRDRKLDFMMLFSSLASITREAGQSDYVAANAYLDAYAGWAWNEYPSRKTISVNWDNFRSIGMAHRASVEKSNLKNFFQDSLSPSQAMKIIERILGSEEPQVIISVENLNKRIQEGTAKNQEKLIQQALKTEHVYERPELSSEFAKPVTRLQKHIADIWAEAFSLKSIGIQDNFFELGGDSLYAIGIVNELKKFYQVDMTDLYNCPTVQMLSEELESRTFSLKQQLEKVKELLRKRKNRNTEERELKEERETYKIQCKKYDTMKLVHTKEWEQILLLGGTGYLGIYLLKELFIQTKAKVVLVVRPGKGGNGSTRIQKKFCTYFGEELYQQYESRLRVLDGAITEQQFGLEDSVYQKLAQRTECIINASGKADHYGEYEAFYEANVSSVQQMIAFAKTGRKKEIHHMSTKGIGTGRIQNRESILFTEFDTDFGQEFDNYYVATKHESEKLLINLRNEAYDVNIYRIGDVVYDSANGHFQEKIDKNAVYLLMQAVFELDCLPEMELAFLEFSYVDFISKAAVSLMRQGELRQETYHLLNPDMLCLKDLKDALERSGRKTNYVNEDVFFQYIADYYDDEKKKEAIHNFLTYSHLLELPEYTEFEIASDKTCYILEQLHLKWKKPDNESLDKMISYGQKVHFFPVNTILEQ